MDESSELLRRQLLDKTGIDDAIADELVWKDIPEVKGVFFTEAE